MTNTLQNTNLSNAAKFYLVYQGMKGTAKQIENLIKQLPAESIIMMAAKRGF